MTPVKLSARALGVLLLMTCDRSLTSAEKVSGACLEGRRAILSAMKDLENHGFIRRVTNRYLGHLVSHSEVTEMGFEFISQQCGSSTAGIALVTQLPQPYSNYAHSNHYDGRTYTTSVLVKSVAQGATREVLMPYDFFKPTSSNDNLLEDAARHEREKRQVSKRIPFQQKPPIAWNCSDTVHYFLECMIHRWDIPHTALTKTEFIKALGSKRKALQTNGEVEQRMVDLFFAGIGTEKFANGDHLWRSFLKRFNDIAVTARASITSPEEEMAAQAAADKSWEWAE